MKGETGGPAFPTDSERQIGPNSYHYEGMTLRDYFAAEAIDLFSIGRADIDRIRAGEPVEHEIVAEFCYAVADAMLKAREATDD